VVKEVLCEKVLKVKPNDDFAINNIGAKLMQYGRIKKHTLILKGLLPLTEVILIRITHGY